MQGPGLQGRQGLTGGKDGGSDSPPAVHHLTPTPTQAATAPGFSQLLEHTRGEAMSLMLQRP